jgi:hypothetical protein
MSMGDLSTFCSQENLIFYLTSHTCFAYFLLKFKNVVKSKWIKDLNIRPRTLKLIQKRVGNTLELVGIGKNFSMKPQQHSN